MQLVMVALSPALEDLNENSPFVPKAKKEYGVTSPLKFETDESSVNFSLGTMESGLTEKRLLKTNTTFWEDARHFHEGTIPQSIVLAVVVGIACGISAYVYYFVLELLLDLVWKTLPENYIVDVWPEWAHVLWIPLVGFTLVICVGLSVLFLGDPGDLPYTIKCVHEKGYIAMSHVMPMVAASLFSIVGGGSLGPEAPLVAVCAALGGFISRKVFKQKNRNVVRKHTLMGMAGALSAFFGVPLGGSLFALEVNSRFGVEYFEHIVESILCGEVCLAVFRSLARLPIQSIWSITTPKLDRSTPLQVLIGFALGLTGALVAYCFTLMHWRIMALFSKFDLLCEERAVYRGLLGGSVVLGLGMIIPHTLFWGETEFQTLASLSLASTLPHVWPTSGLIGFEMESTLTCLIVGITKLVAISFTVVGGYRGGFIFPLFTSGAAFGRAIAFLIPAIPVQLAVLCMAAAINVALTRTSIATSLILVFLSGEQDSMSAVLASSLASLFATAYMVRRYELFDYIFVILNLYAFLTLCADAHLTSVAVHKISNREE
jgi:H+/Cl- antiporter ClcA